MTLRAVKSSATARCDTRRGHASSRPLLVAVPASRSAICVVALTAASSAARDPVAGLQARVLASRHPFSNAPVSLIPASAFLPFLDFFCLVQPLHSPPTPSPHWFGSRPRTHTWRGCEVENQTGPFSQPGRGVSPESVSALDSAFDSGATIVALWVSSASRSRSLSSH